MALLEGNEGMANFFLRIGLALTILWSVRTKFMGPEGVSGMMGQLGLSFMTPGFVTALAFVLLLLSIMLIIGWQVRTAGLLLTIFFAVSTIAGIFAGDAIFGVGPAIWKDFALLGGAIALMLGGAGTYSIDER